MNEKQTAGEDGADDAGQGAETLGHAQVGALFIRRGIEGNHSEDRRTVQARPDGEQRQDNENFRQTFREGQPRQARGKNDEAEENQVWLTEFFYEPADDTLDQRGDDTGIGEEIADTVGNVLFIGGKMVFGQQGKGGFKAGETKSGHEENTDEKTHSRLG